MRISYNWLKELLPALTHSPEALAELLTSHSYETVVAERISIDPQVKVVRIEALAAHPNADRLRLATVTDGATTTTVVCGAPNIAVGDVVPFALPGTTLKDEEGNNFVLKEASIRGQKSPGMLNSLRELGIGTSHSGIFILPPDTPLGSLLVEHLPADVILEADITPNRAHDSLSIMGIAREIAALLDLPVKAVEDYPLPAPEATIAGWTVAIDDAEEVPRYMGALVKNIAVAPSPLWLQVRLLSMGARPINNVVDITNYVMFELGNPTHAFDAQKLTGTAMGVRWARTGEQMVTLDGVPRKLTEATLVITNDDTPVAVAGIMGGQASEVEQATHTLFIEVANFKPFTIQQMVKALGLRTEGAARWIKGVDANQAELAMARTVQLLAELAGGEVQGVIDQYPSPRQLPHIPFEVERYNSLMGTKNHIDVATAVATLRRLGNTVDVVGSQVQVTPRSERLDITGEHDVIEEVVRVQGLAQIIGETPVLPAQPEPLPPAIAWREAVRDTLVGMGYTETYNYSFENSVLAGRLGFTSEHPVTITNPTAPELATLRTSVVLAVLGNTVKNRAEFRRQRLFEVGTIFEAGSGGVVPGVREEVRLAGVVVEDSPNTMAEIAAVVAKLLGEMGITAYAVESAKSTASWQGETQVLAIKKTVVGSWGLLSTQASQRLKLPPSTAWFELSLDVLIAAAKNVAPVLSAVAHATPMYQAPSKFPPVFRDISLVVAPEVQIETVQQIIERVGGELVVEVDLFDVYDAADVEHDPALRKSLAFHLKYQAPDRTLAAEEAQKIHQKISQALQTELGAHVRE